MTMIDKIPSVSKGWAGYPGGDEFSKKLSTRFQELKHLEPVMRANCQNLYGRNVYRGNVPEGVELSNDDIAIICDSGNCCFGSSVKRSGASFECTIWTD